MNEIVRLVGEEKEKKRKESLNIVNQTIITTFLVFVLSEEMFFEEV